MLRMLNLLIAELVLMLLVAACAHLPKAERATLDGAWQSAPGRPLLQLSAMQASIAGEADGLVETSPVSHLVQVYRGSRAMMIHDGECGEIELIEIQRTGANAVTVQFYDGQARPTIRRRFIIDGDTILAPIKSTRGGTREVFTRIDEQEVVRRWACAASIFE